MNKEELSIAFESNDISKILFGASKKYASSVAMIDDETGMEVTFETFRERSVSLCLGMKKLGIEENEVVTLMSGNSVDFFIAFMACLFGGFVVHTLNPGYTTYELNHCLNISKAKTIICTKNLLERVEKYKEEYGSNQRIIVMDSDESCLLSMQDVINIGKVNWQSFLPRKIDPFDNVACLVNSSGTTGLPKCVQLTYCNLSRAAAVSLFLNLDSTDVVLNVVPCAHTFGIIIIIFCFVNGIKLVMSKSFQPEKYLASLGEYKVTTLFVVPQLVYFLLNTPLIEKYDLSSLRCIYNGGASLSANIIMNATKRFNIKVHQIYGLSETTGAITYNSMETGKFDSVGTLLPLVENKVIDLQTGVSLGPSGRGELCFRGLTVMKGYKDNSEASKASIDADGFLHTGDVGYCDEDGYIYIIDRVKDLIKYKGYQVSPTEIESLLITHETVKDVAVIGIPHDVCGELALAYVVPCKETTAKDLQQFVADHLSRYKHLHGGVEFCDEIPKTASGKILRRMLLEQYKKKHNV